MAAAAWQLGIAHPPGHPLALLVGKFVCLLPLGSIAFRVGLASAVCQAGASALVARLADRLIGAIAPKLAARPRGLLAMAAGWLYGTTYSATFQAVRPEVYALSTLLLVATALHLVEGLSQTNESSLRRAALLGGLGLANHHLLALAVALPAFFVLVRPWRRAIAAGLAVAISLMLYGYLPLRAQRHPTIDWGAPTTIERFVWTVSARAFQKSLERGRRTDSGMVLGATTAESNLVGLFAGVVGLWLLIRRRHVAIGVLLASSICLTIVASSIVGFDETNPDAYGYLSGALALLAAVAATPFALLLSARRRATLLAGLLATMAPLALLRHARFDLSRHTTTDSVAAWIEGAPPRRLLVTSYFQTAFLALYAQSVEGRRPDLLHVDRHFLTYPGYRDEILARWPHLLPHLGMRDVVPSVRDAVVEYAQDLPATLIPISSLPEVPLTTEPQARRFVAWMRLLAVDRSCRLGDRQLFEQSRQRAASLLGSDEYFLQLLLRCKNLGTLERP